MPKTICIFGASSDNINPIYIQQGEELGKLIAKNNHKLIFGGGATGLMGAVSRGVLAEGGFVTGVAPTFFEDDNIEKMNESCQEFIYTESMRERKYVMEENADMFIVTPGGIGTLEEFFEVLTLKQLGRHNKPIILFNVEGCYEGLRELLDKIVRDGFLGENDFCVFCNNLEEIESHIRAL